LANFWPDSFLGHWLPTKPEGFKRHPKWISLAINPGPQAQSPL
jgi:hypothetical protein